MTLCRHLKKQGVDLSVAYLRERVKGSRSLRGDFENENIPVFDLHANGRYDPRFFSRLAALLRRERPDILHTHLPRADLAGAFARFFDPSLIWICSVHGIYSAQWSGGWTLPLFKRLWRRADAMLCISEAVREWLIDGGISEDKAKLIYYGIETEAFSQPRMNLRQAWGLDGGAVIGSIGRLEPRKNHECLIRAMPKILKSIPHAMLLIGGHDPLGHGRKLDRLIDELALGDRVKVIGFQNDVGSFLEAIDVFAFATRSEGFGLVLVEAMASGKPVVASKIPPVTEIVVDGETGVLVQCEDSNAFAANLSRLLSSTEERRRMGCLGRQRVQEHFTAARMSRETQRLYEELLHYPSVSEFSSHASNLEGGLGKE